MSIQPVRVSRPRDVDYNRPHSVYRAFDSYGLLLYVGCSLNPTSRLATHRSGSPWFRFAESIGVTGSWDRDEALRREREAIESEGPYFNSSYADMERTKANARAAVRALASRGWVEPHVDFDDWDQYEREHGAWHRAMEAERTRLKSGARPYLTDADRTARYLAAREDAELARQETAA